MVMMNAKCTSNQRCLHWLHRPSWGNWNDVAFHPKRRGNEVRLIVQSLGDILRTALCDEVRSVCDFFHATGDAQ